MGVRQLSDFKVGDRVRLIAPFRCQGDGPDYDQELQRELKIRSKTKVIAGTVEHIASYVEVGFDCWRGRPLKVDPDVLDFDIPPATDEEVQTAIRSITEALGG